MKGLTGLLLLVSVGGCSTAPTAEPACARAGVSIEYDGVERLVVWGKQLDFGSFSISNESSRNIELPLDSADSPAIIHGDYEELQSRPASSNLAWDADVVVIEHFSPPNNWMVVEPGDRARFFSDFVGPLSDLERSSSREYRVVLEDAHGCRYTSEAFRIAESP